MTLAIFDIDGTLVRGRSERMFWRYLVAHGRQGPRQIFAYLWLLLRCLPTSGVHAPKKNKAYLCGLATADITKLAAEFVATQLVPRLYEPTVQRVQQHLRRGDTVLLLSGTLDPIARALAEHLGVRHVCATLCSERHGRYLARPPTVHPFGGAKVSLARRFAAQIGVDLSHACAYADSGHDLLLLEAVGEPVAVEPDRRLFATAVANDWEIIAEGDVRGTLSH